MPGLLDGAAGATSCALKPPVEEHPVPRAMAKLSTLDDNASLPIPLGKRPYHLAVGPVVLFFTRWLVFIFGFLTFLTGVEFFLFPDHERAAGMVSPWQGIKRSAEIGGAGLTSLRKPKPHSSGRALHAAVHRMITLAGNLADKEIDRGLE